jgi:type I restriction enzyme S subunit
MKLYKLSELIKIKNGRDHKDLTDGNIPVYGSGGIMRYANAFLYDKPSILLPRKGSLTNIQYCKTPFWTVDTLYYTEVNMTLANPYYLYRYLSRLDLSVLDSGTGVPSMTFDSYYNIKVMLPDIEIQNRVARFLQCIDANIETRNSINRNLPLSA